MASSEANSFKIWCKKLEDGITKVSPREVSLEDVKELSDYIRSIGDDEDPADGDVFDETRFFLQKCLLPILRHIKKSCFPDRDIFAAIMSLMRHTIVFCINRLPLDEVVSITILRQILDDEAIFHGIYAGERLDTDHYGGPDLDEEESDAEDEKEPKMIFAQPFRRLSSSLPHLVNFFGERGGFDAMIFRIEDANNKPPLKMVFLYLKVLEENYRVFRPDFIGRFVLRFKDATFGLIESMTDDDLKAVSKQHLVGTIKSINYFLSQEVTSSVEAGKMIEEFQLKLAIKCLNCNSLQKRLQGLGGLSNLVEMAQRRGRTGGNTYGYSNTTQVTRWLTAEYLIDWIQENKIVEDLFGARMHLELVKRSESILMLLTSYKRLEIRHLDLMWDQSVGKQEVLAKAIYALLGRVLSFMDRDQNEHILERICELKFKKFPVYLLRLLESLILTETFLIKIQGEDENDVSMGLELIWRLVQDESGANEEVVAEALPTMQECLTRDRAQSQRFHFMKLCLDNIRASKSVFQALAVLRTLIDTFAYSAHLRVSNSDSRAGVVEQLQREYNLVDLLVKDVVNYFDTAHGILRNKPIDGGADDSRLMVGYYEHREHVRQRFFFLETILRYMVTGGIAQEHIDTLWDCFMTHTVCPEDKDYFYDWLTNICGCYQRIVMPELVDYLFQEKLSTVDFSDLTEAGWRCFETCFRMVNGHKGAIEKAEDEDDFIIVDFSLTGLPALWRLVLDARVPLVVDTSMQYIHLLYQRCNTRSAVHWNQLRETYIESIMQSLEVAKSSMDEQRDVSIRRLHRCLDMLRDVVEDYVAHAAAYGERFRGEQMTLLMTEEDHDSPVIKLHMHAADTFAEVRLALAQELNVLASSLSLTVRHHALREDQYLTPVEDRIEHMEQIFYTINYNSGSSPPQVASPSQTDVQVPARTHSAAAEDRIGVPPAVILSSNETYFKAIFSLLDGEAEVAGHAWELIQLLPVNSAMREQIWASASSHNWSSLIDVRSCYSLLYSVKIVESLALSSGDSREAKERRLKWCNSFIKDGGMEHLCQVLLTKDDLITGPVRKNCLVSLLSMIQRLLVVGVPGASGNTDYVLSDDASFLDKGDFLKRLLELMGEVGRETREQQSAVDGQLLHFAVSLLSATMCSSPSELLTQFWEYDHLDALLEDLLLTSRDEIVRREIVLAIFGICRSLSFTIKDVNIHPIARFVPILFSFIKNIEPANDTCADYFECLCELVQFHISRGRAEVMSSDEEDNRVNDSKSMRDLFSSFQLNYDQRVEELILLMKTHPVVESDKEEDTIDHCLCGLLRLLTILMDADAKYRNERSLIEHVFCQFLFRIPTSSNHGRKAPPTCKRSVTRRLAFRLLRVLCKDNEDNQQDVLSWIHKLHLNIPSQYGTDWNYSPTSEQKSSVGYVGIKNLGCICYMNSLLQQLFMMPQFRKGILSTKLFASDTEQKELSDNKILTRELQTMYAFLQESQKQYYDPTSFCKAYKDYDGNPTDVCVQMDVDEFFNMLCEKVEDGLKNTNNEKLMSKIWEGNLCSQLICKGCPHYSETRGETFYTVILDINNRSSITEALEFYVKGEMLEGDNAYLCQKCDKKVDTLMRHCIKKLPNTLILTLKRFEFNFDTMRKGKINDFCQFPIELNMEPYTREGLARRDIAVTDENADDEEEQDSKKMLQEAAAETHDPSYYNYNLAGILVHRGVADHGHYYSFIKQRDGADGDKWIEFNDDLVCPFDIRAIEKESFGGTEEVMSVDSMGMRSRKVVYRNKSAYMLVYERVPQEQWKDAEEESSKSTPEEEDSWLVTSQKEEEEFSVQVPRVLYEAVWEENVKFLQDKKVFDPEYFNFVMDVVSMCPRDLLVNNNYCIADCQTNMYLFVGIKYMLEVLTHSKEKGIFEQFIEQLEVLMENNIPANYFFCETMCRSMWLQSLMLECTVGSVRDNVANLVGASMRRLLSVEEPQFLQFIEPVGGSELTRSSPDPDSALDTSIPCCIRIIDKLLEVFPSLPWHWRTFGEYFKILTAFAEFGAIERQYLLKRDIVGLCLDLMLANESPNEGKSLTVKVKMGDKFDVPNHYHIVHLLSVLVRGCVVDRDFKDCPPSPYELEDEPIPLPLHVASMFSTSTFIRKVINFRSNLGQLAVLLCHLCWNNEGVSTVVLTALRDGINDMEFDQLKPWFAVLRRLIAMDDEEQLQRINYMLLELFKIVDKFKKYRKFTTNMLQNIFSMYHKIPAVKDWMDDNVELWDWTVKWLEVRNLTIEGFGATRAYAAWDTREPATTTLTRDTQAYMNLHRQ